MSTSVPEQLGARYEIGKLLGRGGMAEVHLGQDSRLDRTVAVKMLRSDLARDPTFQARFRKEAQSAASLNHPSVVAVYDTGEDEFAGNPVPYIVMEYVGGSTLKEHMASGVKLVPERALELVDDVLAALAYSHQQGIVHRDIKPANVMLTPGGDVKVMDFGIARVTADAGATMTQTAAVLGTAQYLSPEQARGEQVDARSDLYSTGCLLYELLTGRPPFVGEAPAAMIYQHVHQEPTPPSSLDPDVPRNVDSIVLKALAKDRDERYQSADEMRTDIAAALAGRPVAAPVPPARTQPVERTAVVAGTATYAPVDDTPARPTDRRAGRALGYGLLAIAVLAVFVIAALIGREIFGVGGADEVQVPDVGGLTVPQAERLLDREGLRLGDQTTRNDESIPAGNIIDQSPEPRNSLERGSPVSVVVSAGVEETTVPSLVGLSLDQAREALREADLELGDSNAVPSEEPRGTVTRVRPREDETVPVGSEVNIRYASGNNEVPRVVGDSEDAARSTLEQAGFEADAREEETDDAEPGTVVSQSPGQGETARLGSTVVIVVAVAPPEPTPTPTPIPTTTPPATPTPTVTPTG